MNHKPVNGSPDTPMLAANARPRNSELATLMQTIAGRLKDGQDRHYMVGLGGYFIEGTPYPATALSVGPHTTHEIQINTNGFSCLAFFTPELLSPSTLQAPGIRTIRLEGRSVDRVQVHLEARYRDIFFVVDCGPAEHHILFFDLAAFARISAFLEEAQQWFARREPGH